MRSVSAKKFYDDIYTRSNVDYLGSTSGRFKSSGITIFFDLYGDGEFFYLIPTIFSYEEEWIEANDSGDHEYLEITREWIKKFGCGIFDNLDDINNVLSEECNGAEFYEGDDGEIYGQ